MIKYILPSIRLQNSMISIFLTVVLYKKDKEGRDMFGGGVIWCGVKGAPL